jgi:hypothetical protein
MVSKRNWSMFHCFRFCALNTGSHNTVKSSEQDDTLNHSPISATDPNSGLALLISTDECTW